MNKQIPLQQHVYLDVFGNPLTKGTSDSPNESKYFLVVAVLIDATKSVWIEAEIDDLRKKFFRKGELDYPAIASHDQRKEHLAEELIKSAFSFYVLAIDQRVVREDQGLIYTEPYMDFLQGVLYRTLFRSIHELHLYADALDPTGFFKGFEDCIRKNYVPNLFERTSLNLVTRREHPMLQLAHFLAGTMADVLERSRHGRGVPRIYSLLRQRALRIEEWPPHARAIRAGSPVSELAPHDQLICDYCLEMAEGHILKHQLNPTDPELYQVEVVKYLLFCARFLTNKKYVSAEEILKAIEHLPPITVQYLRSQVIAKLRDAGVLLASSPKGYKIPMGVSDLTDFVDRTDSVIHPMLNRLFHARQQILTLTKHQVDLLSSPKYAHLWAIANEER
jgi:hypothetical protein